MELERVERSPLEVDDILEAINKTDFLRKLPFVTKTSVQLIDALEKNDVLQSHVVLFSAFNHLIFNILGYEDMKRVVGDFVKIPKKKMQKISDKKTFEWIVIQLAKKFYHPITSLPIREKYLDIMTPQTKAYQLMAFYVAQYHTKMYSLEESLELHKEDMKARKYLSVARFLFTLMIIDLGNETIFNLIKEIGEHNIINNVSHALNEEINRQGLILMKYGRNETLVDFTEDITELADSAIKENLENIIKERNEYAKTISEYEIKMSELERELAKSKAHANSLQIENSKMKNNPILSNLTVLVIGSTGRKLGYKELVEKYGGDFMFIDGVEDATRARHFAVQADIVFHITSYGFHIVTRQIEDLENVVFVNNDGLKSLDKAILGLREQLKVI